MIPKTWRAVALAGALSTYSVSMVSGCTRSMEANPDHFVGIGVELTMEAKGARIIRLVEGGEASEAGLVVDDVILEVDGNSLRGLGLAEAVDLIRGAPDTRVDLVVRTKEGDRKATLKRRALENR